MESVQPFLSDGLRFYQTFSMEFLLNESGINGEAHHTMFLCAT